MEKGKRVAKPERLLEAFIFTPLRKQGFWLSSNDPNLPTRLSHKISSPPCPSNTANDLGSIDVRQLLTFLLSPAPYLPQVSCIYMRHATISVAFLVLSVFFGFIFSIQDFFADDYLDTS